MRSIALCVIRTDHTRLTQNGTRRFEARMRRSVELNGFEPAVVYHPGPIPPPELAQAIEARSAALLVVPGLDTVGPDGFRVARCLVDVWDIEQGATYRRITRQSAHVRIEVRETFEQAAERIRGELSEEVTKMEETMRRFGFQSLPLPERASV